MSGRGLGQLLTQLLGSHVGFAINRPTHVHRSMVPLADTAASGNIIGVVTIQGRHREFCATQGNVCKHRDILPEIIN